ncbi:S8 family serine peptidase [Jiangella asiatica]|uniref:Peptidase S8 n=1 Tax=Jiangella asiatica TaxID=2530372 RepID=A0A4R5DEF7_9ACTN|nr:S8 family serine peptidase [Jiangella asiatica]TDE11487.1 peptidase S8 [Jiangella asiatica]
MPRTRTPLRRRPMAALVVATLVVGLAGTSTAAPDAGAGDAAAIDPSDTAATAVGDGETWRDKVEPQVLSTLEAGETADVMIAFDERADLGDAALIDDWTERGTAVVEQLQATAEESQRDVRAFLDQAGVDYESYWMANAILVHDATESVARRVADRPGVDQVLDVHQYEPPQLLPTDPAEAEAVAAQAAGEWGVTAIGADRVWSDVDVSGEGLIIANIDTGVQFDHPSLAARYRGTNADGSVSHDYNWFDPSGICPDAAPCDNQGHGTHTMGTMAGGDEGGTAIGVAPGARWIAAKGCEATAQVGCSTPALIASGQWTLAPTDLAGQNPRTDLRPHIVNNSWGSDTRGFADPFYDQIVDAWNAAGVFAIFSSGNDGMAGCATVGSPADSPNAYAVGSHDVANAIAATSSRGPGPDGRIRPDIAAPGVAVTSSIPEDRYASASGTSMASPHVSGTVALMWAAAPSLIGDVDGTRELLGGTAVDTEELSCGGTAENNNSFGEGRLDAYAAVNASPIGATGWLAGRITDAETGEPVAGAAVRAVSEGYERTTLTDEDGRYETTLVEGAYEVTVTAYGYEPATRTGLDVTGDATITQDVPLTALPSVTVSGTVTDGSGQGWPLYAGLTIEGYPHGVIWTEPETGRYEIELPADTTYRVTVVTEYAGYTTLREELTVGGDDLTADLAIEVGTVECVAPGYEQVHDGAFAAFDDGLPDGWTVETARGDGWVTGDPGGRTNLTGGDADFVSVDSAFGGRLEDSVLMSPVTDLSGVDDPVLAFRSDLLLTRGVAEVDISVDGGATWENVWTRTALQRGPRQELVPIAAAAGAGEVQARFHYRNDTSNNGWWALDDVLIGARSCAPAEGGLVVGQVVDDRTDAVVDGATVSTEDGVRATTVDTPNDPELDGGLYWLFSPQPGERELTAEHELGQYGTQTREIDVADGELTHADFALGTGELAVSSTVVEGSVEVGGSSTATVTVTNVGTAPASFELAERDTGFEQQQETLASLPSAPLRLSVVDDDGGPLDPQSAAATAGDASSAPAPSPDPNEAQWQRLHDMTIPRTDGLAAVHEGKLYYVGGMYYTGSTRQRDMIYDIRTDEWRLTEAFQEPRNKAAGGFIGDLLYVVGGWSWSEETATTLVYDPATDSWSERSPAPIPFAAAGYTILDGKLYVIGGITPDTELNGSTAVQVYDAATDTWSRVADYPEPAAWQSCGPIDGLIYCAGGQGPDARHSDRGYVYNPATDAWYRIADLPIPVTQTANSAANGLLMISGGQVGGYRSNQGFYYDPAAAQWAALPNSIFDVYRLAGTCGFYKLGGTQGQPGTFPWVEQLPGFDDCQTATEDPVPWMSVDGERRTLEPGESAEVTVTLDAGAAEANQPGEYLARLLLLEDTPATAPALTVSMDATAPSSWGLVTGTVTGLGRCDAPGAPVAGASVELRGAKSTVEVTTDANGVYRHWMDRSERRVTVTASADGYTSGDGAANVVAGETAARDLTLRLDESCAAAAPAELELTVRARGQAVERITLDNAGGAAGYDFQVSETGEALQPLASGATAASAPVEVAAAEGWTEGTAVPGGRMNYAAAQCPGQPDVGYVFGGADARPEVTPRSWKYDAVADTWQELAPIPEAGQEAVAVCEAGKIHVLGGDATDRHYVYDIARNTWAEAAPLPEALDGAAAAAWDGRVYVAGGAPDGDWYGTSGDLFVYDIATDTWTEGEPMPVPVRRAGFAQAGTHLYVVGGMSVQGTDAVVHDSVQRLDLREGTWSAGPALAAPRAGLSLAVTDQAVYAVGGEEDRPPYGRLPTTTVQRLALADWDSGTWTIDPADDLPRPVHGAPAGFCTEARTGGEIWSVGGNGSSLNSAWYLPVGERCAGTAADVPWLSVRGTVDGTIAADGSARVSVHVDGGSMRAGESYVATLLVDTTDPGAPQLRIPVRVTVR